MSAMANVTLIIATVKNASVKEKTLKETDAVPKAIFLDFYKEHYKDILLIILNRTRHDKRKKSKPDWILEKAPIKTRGRERHDDRSVFNHLSHRKKSVHKRLSDTYSPSITLSGASSRDPSHSRGRSLSRDCHRIRDCLHGIEDIYDDTYSSHGIRTKCRDRSCDKNYSRSVKRWRESKSPPPRGSKSSTSDRGHWKSRAKRRKPADEEDLSIPWTCEEVDSFTPRIHNFKSSQKTRLPNNVKTYDGTRDPKGHMKIFQAAAQVERWAMPTWCHMFNSTLIEGLQKKYVKDLVEIHNIKQRDGETIEEFMERFKIKTGCIKGAPEYKRIFEVMHGVNNPELTKCLNKHVPKTMEEMMTATMAFIRGKTVATSKKKVHTPWKSQDQSKRHIPEQRSNFQNQPKDGWGSNKFTPLTRTPKEIFTTESGKFKPPSPMVTLVEKRSSNKFCEFHNDKGHSTDECVQLRKHGIREIQAIPSTTHEMLKFPVNGEIVTIRSTILTPTECATIAATPKDFVKKAEARHKNFKVAIHPDFPDQEITIGGTISTKAQTELSETALSETTHAAPKAKEELIMYLSASYGAISAVLMTERDTVQTPVYFLSRALQAPELNYTTMEKLVLTLVCAAKRLRRYFQAHPIVVITNQPIKQILADFLIEKPDDAPPEASVIETSKELWTLFTDRSSCVEYEALIAGLRITAQMGVRNMHVNADSKLVENQVLRTYVAKEENMIKYLEKAKSLINGFANFSISQVPRSKNKKADALSKIASTSFAHLSKQVLVKVLKEKSLQEREMARVVEEEGPTWMTPILEYFRDETLSDNRNEARKLRIKAKQYELLEGILCRRSFFKPWLRCVRPLQADYPTMHRDAREMIRKCKDCQIHCPVPRHPQQLLTPIMTPWPYKWGIEMAGPFLEGLWKVMFLIVAMDYFTKWVEAKTVATITRSQVKKFVWDNIVCRFGLPEEIVSDNRIKAHLSEGNKNWLEEHPRVLWAHRTMIKSSNDDTLFSLTYGTEAVIPAEIRMPTYSTTVVDAVHNDEELRLNLDLHEERRERFVIREAKAKLKMTKYYNTRVRGVTFRPGDFFYRSNNASHIVDGGKLGLK
nr:hypothetical protein [Tanacetum cinerariifolium]